MASEKPVKPEKVPAKRSTAGGEAKKASQKKAPRVTNKAATISNRSNMDNAHNALSRKKLRRIGRFADSA